jgi:uncharacterized protein
VRIIDGQVRLAASDVANFLACRHLTRLDLLRARGVIEPPHLYDAGFEDLVKRGEAHEKVILQGFRERGLQVVEITADRRNVAAGVDATRSAGFPGAGRADSGAGWGAPAATCKRHSVLRGR